MKIDNEANFRKLWKELAKAPYLESFNDKTDKANYKINLAKQLGIYNYHISNECMASCPACYEAFKRAKVSMRKCNHWYSGADRRFPCSKCPLDWGKNDCECGGTLFTKWENANSVRTTRKYAKLISEMEWK